MLSLIALPLGAALNRLGGAGVNHGRVLAALGMGALAALFIAPLWHAPLWALAFLGWRSLPWGHLIGCGRHTPDRPMDAFQTALLKLARGNVHVALGLRMAVASPALLFLSGWLPALLFPLLAVASYEVAWWLHTSARDGGKPYVADPLKVAEPLTGAVLGGCLAFAAL